MLGSWLTIDFGVALENNERGWRCVSVCLLRIFMRMGNNDGRQCGWKLREAVATCECSSTIRHITVLCSYYIEVTEMPSRASILSHPDA